MKINTGVVSGVVLAPFDGVVKILLLKRSVENYWCHVAGKIEGDELAWQAMLRELYEETKLDTSMLYNADYQQQFYCSSSEQLIIATGFVIYCPVGSTVMLNHEHTEYRWCSLDEAMELVPFPNQRNFYAHVWQNFVDASPSQQLRIAIK